MKKIILLSAALATLVACDKGPKVTLQPWESYRNPVVQENVEDPAVLASGGKFYVYYNGAGEDDVIPILESEDLTGWDGLTPAFNALTAPAPMEGCTIRSCSVVAWQEGFLMYYTASAASSVIGVALAPFPTGPWADEGTLVNTVTEDAVLVGAPSAYEDGGTLHLVVETTKGIYSMALSADGKNLAAGAPVYLASSVFKAPVMYKHGGKWYLVATTGNVSGAASSTARVVYGRSDNPEGPFVTKDGSAMLDGAAEVLLEGGKKFAGPGSSATPLDLADGTSWLLYNAYDLADVSRGRTLMLDPIQWADGWMSVRGSIPSFCSDKPDIKK